MTEIKLGPVSLEAYEYFAESEPGAALLDRVMRLLMPLGADFDVHWSVQDRRRPPRLGVASANSRLGVNSHLGGEALPGSGMGRVVPMPASEDAARGEWGQGRVEQ